MLITFVIHFEYGINAPKMKNMDCIRRKLFKGRELSEKDIENKESNSILVTC